MYGENQSIETIQLDKFKMALELRLGRVRASQLELQSRYDERLDDLAIHVEKRMYGEHRVKEFTNSFKYPASWWQHFKEECFPKFLLRRWPVEYKTETQTTDIHTYYEFPEAFRDGDHTLGNFIVYQYLEADPLLRDWR